MKVRYGRVRPIYEAKDDRRSFHFKGINVELFTPSETHIYWNGVIEEILSILGTKGWVAYAVVADSVFNSVETVNFEYYFIHCIDMGDT